MLGDVTGLPWRQLDSERWALGTAALEILTS
jgi:hypothetical protein